jgi:hypothetical protein
MNYNKIWEKIHTRIIQYLWGGCDVRKGVSEWMIEQRNGIVWENEKDGCEDFSSAHPSWDMNRWWVDTYPCKERKQRQWLVSSEKLQVFTFFLSSERNL